MTPDYLVVRREWTMRHVLDHIRAHGRDRETLNVIYITDEHNKLVDDLRIREILLSPLHAHVSDLMDNQFVSLCVTDRRKTAVEVFGKYDRTALPVVDTQGRMAGIITLDDVLDVAEQEATRDLQRFGGLEALDDPYMSTSLPSMIRKRASWLVILFVGEMLTATAMGFFEKQIARAVVLALFVPLIISSGGNSGSQAATLDHPRTRARRSRSEGLVARHAPRARRRRVARMHPRLDRIHPDRRLECILRYLRASLDPGRFDRQHVADRRGRLGNPYRAPCSRFFYGDWVSTRQPLPPRSWPRWLTSPV